MNKLYRTPVGSTVRCYKICILFENQNLNNMKSVIRPVVKHFETKYTREVGKQVKKLDTLNHVGFVSFMYSSSKTELSDTFPVPRGDCNVITPLSLN